MKKHLIASLFSVGLNVGLTVCLTAARAEAESLSCLVGVYRAQDMLATTADPLVTTQVLTLPLMNGAGEQDFQVNGETVAVSATRYQHTDLYSLDIVLTTPAAERFPHRGFVAVITDHIFNDGPTKENGFDIKPGPGATRFAFLKRQAGTFAMSSKVVAALKVAKKWGTYPFNETQVDVNSADTIRDFILEQLTAKTLEPTDVVGISTIFSCTREK